MDKLRVGVIGAGRIGKVHTESISLRVQGADVLMLSDIQVEEAKRVAKRFGIPDATSDYKDILKNPDIDAVVICSPTNMHARQIMESAAAGKHIFCEKPIDLSLDAIQKALAAVEKAGVKLMVGFNRRFDPNFMKVRDMVVSGRIGDPQILQITSRDPGPPPPEYVAVSGGIFLDMTIHDFDMARYIVGSEVVEVFAKGSVLIDPAIGKAGDLDTVVVTLLFENGAIGTIGNSRKAVYGYDQRVEIHGSKGMAMADNKKVDTHEFYDEKGSHGALLLNFFMDRYTEAYANEMAAFCAAVLKNEPLPVSGRDGLLAVAIGLAAKLSVRENRPVKVSEVMP